MCRRRFLCFSLGEALGRRGGAHTAGMAPSGETKREEKETGDKDAGKATKPAPMSVKDSEFAREGLNGPPRRFLHALAGGRAD